MARAGKAEKRTHICSVCGNVFQSYRHDTEYCSIECLRRALLPLAKKETDLTKTEKEARKQGKHYADLQKEKTLASIGKIHIPAEFLSEAKKKLLEAEYGENWREIYEAQV